MAVAQLLERSLPTPEVHSSIPIGYINNYQISTNCNLEKTKIKKKRPAIPYLFEKKSELLRPGQSPKLANIICGRRQRKEMMTNGPRVIYLMLKP